MLVQSIRRPNPSVTEQVPDQEAHQRAQPALLPGSPAPFLVPIPGLLEHDSSELPGQAPHQLEQAAEGVDQAVIPGGKAQQSQAQVVSTYEQGREQKLGVQKAPQYAGQDTEVATGQTAARSPRLRPEERLEATGFCTLENWGDVNVPGVEAPGKQTVSQVAGSW